MTWAEIKTQFYIKWGDIYTEYFDNNRLNGIFTESYRRVVEEQYNIWQNSKKNLTLLSGLMGNLVAAPTTPTTLTKPADYKYYISMNLKYTYQSTIYYREAEMERLGSLYNPLDLATVKQPWYYEDDNAFILIPTKEGVNPTEVTLLYLEEPVPCNLNLSPSNSPQIPDFLIDRLILQALRIAAEISGDVEVFQMQSAEEKENQ